jgi:hypothetical protein
MKKCSPFVDFDSPTKFIVKSTDFSKFTGKVYNVLELFRLNSFLSQLSITRISLLKSILSFANYCELQ